MKAQSPFKLSSTHFKKFFAQMNKAVTALGVNSDEYYRRVLSECAGVSSIKQLPSLELYAKCLRRFALDAGDYAQPADFATEKQKRYAYIIKVMSLQIMQLARLDESNARAYFDAIVNQSRRGAVGFYSRGETFYLDIDTSNLLLFLKILDTHLRRLKKKHFPLFPLSFNDRVKYVADGPIFLREDVDKYYYSRQPFSVLNQGRTTT